MIFIKIAIQIVHVIELVKIANTMNCIYEHFKQMVLNQQKKCNCGFIGKYK